MNATEQLKWKRTDRSSYDLTLVSSTDKKIPRTYLAVTFNRDDVVVNYFEPDHREVAVYNRQTGDVETFVAETEQTPQGKITDEKEGKMPTKILMHKDKFDLQGLYGKDKGLAKLVMRFIEEEF